MGIVSLKICLKEREEKRAVEVLAHRGAKNIKFGQTFMLFVATVLDTLTYAQIFVRLYLYEKLI